ncbi:MAG: AtpZ/AtpI family protein [Acidobacteria bacterium]|nr:AtpZ/AtpI family protein [Acidobacteriota bacterium]
MVSNQQEHSPWRLVGLVLSMGVGFVAAVAVGAGIGWWLDKKLDTAPAFLVIFLILGFIAGLFELYYEMKKLAKW